MWLLIPASDSCFWHQSLHMCLSLQVIGGYMIYWCYSSAFSMVIWTQCEFIKLPRHETHYFIIELINKSSISHYSDIIMSMMVSQVTSSTNVYSTVYSGTDQRKRQSSMSLALVRGIHQSPVNSPHKGPVMWKMFPLVDIIMRDYFVYVCISRKYLHVISCCTRANFLQIIWDQMIHWCNSLHMMPCLYESNLVMLFPHWDDT